MITEEDWNSLDRYGANRMNPKERKAFQERLELDPELAQAYQSIQAMEAKVVRLFGMKRIEAIGQPPRSVPTWLKMAAGVVLVALGYTSWFVLQPKDSTQVPVLVRQPIPTDTTSTPPRTVPLDPISTTLFAHEPLILPIDPDSSGMSLSEEELVLGAAPEEVSAEKQLRHGWDLLQSHRPAQAYRQFQSIKAPEYQQTCDWWSALALVEWKGKDAGKKKMLTILQNSHHAYHSKASQWWLENFGELPSNSSSQ